MSPSSLISALLHPSPPPPSPSPSPSSPPPLHSHPLPRLPSSSPTPQPPLSLLCLPAALSSSLLLACLPPPILPPAYPSNPLPPPPPPQQQQQVQHPPPPLRGTCATCIGVVDETLGSCGALRNCVSTFDDRPDFFIAPWEFPGKLSTAFDELKKALLEHGAAIRHEGDRYIYAVFSGKEGVIDDVEFLFSFPSEDATVNIRAASRAIGFEDNGRNQKRLERIRQTIGWEEVPVLRNRKRALFFLESPWDSFGPEPPPVFDYKSGLEFVPD